MRGLIFKLKQNGISGDVLQILFDFLSNRKQKVLLNGQIRLGPTFTREFRKDLSWGHCYF